MGPLCVFMDKFEWVALSAPFGSTEFVISSRVSSAGEHIVPPHRLGLDDQLRLSLSICQLLRTRRGAHGHVNPLLSRSCLPGLSTLTFPAELNSALHLFSYAAGYPFNFNIKKSQTKKKQTKRTKLKAILHFLIDNFVGFTSFILRFAVFYLIFLYKSVIIF